MPKVSVTIDVDFPMLANDIAILRKCSNKLDGAEAIALEVVLHLLEEIRQQECLLSSS